MIQTQLEAVRVHDSFLPHVKSKAILHRPTVCTIALRLHQTVQIFLDVHTMMAQIFQILLQGIILQRRYLNKIRVFLIAHHTQPLKTEILHHDHHDLQTHTMRTIINLFITLAEIVADHMPEVSAQRMVSNVFHVVA